MLKQSIEVRFIAFSQSLSRPYQTQTVNIFFSRFHSLSPSFFLCFVCRLIRNIETQDRGRKVSNKNHIKNNTYSLMQQNKLFIIIFIATSKIV